MAAKGRVRGVLMGALLGIGFVMLTASEAAGLNIHKLNPQLKQAIAQIGENRPVVVTKTAPVLINTGSNPYIALTYTFAPYELSLGDQIRITLWGQAINNNAGAVALSSLSTLTVEQPLVDALLAATGELGRLLTRES